MGRQPQYLNFTISLGSKEDIRRVIFNKILICYKKLFSKLTPQEAIYKLILSNKDTNIEQNLIISEFMRCMVNIKHQHKLMESLKKHGKEAGLEDFWWDKYT